MTTADPADTFRQEANELLEQLEQVLLDLEQNPHDEDLINSAFRALHTIKGSGAMFGFTEVAAFVHEFETAFDRLRKNRSAITPGLIAVALDARDHIRQLVDGSGTDSSGGEAILARLRSVTDGAPPILDNIASEPAAEPEDAAIEPLATWRIRFKLPADALVYGTNPILLLDEIAAIGPTTVTALTDDVPPLADLDPEVPYLAWQVDLVAADPHAAIDDVFLFLRDGMELSIDRLEETDVTADRAMPEAPPAPALAKAGTTGEKTPAPSAAATVPAPVAPARNARSGATETSGSSLRVAAERLDELMNRVGELVIAQARLTQIAAASRDINLKSIAEELERLSSGLRDTTMGIRMVPIGSLFARFRRLVHDLSHDLGKPIEFITTGEDTELDKTMIERLADPLVHLIRNAVDHGMEDADRRRAAGKPVQGTVRLSAVYAGAEVAITVSDDGAGLDAQRIRAKAEEAGLLAPDAKLSDAELYQLIFAPGFSTAKEVTSLSGRGVGMDVVKRTIEGLRGSIDLTSTPGRGTNLTLRLPLTLAIVDGMLVRVGNGRYTIPLSAVEECVELPAGEELAARGRNFLDIRGSLVPFVRLREVFNTPGEPDDHQKVVIVSSGDGRVGLVVDQIIGNNQTVIKQLSRLHAGVKAFSGATILGDGTVALILDTMHLVSAGQGPDDRHKTEVSGKAA